jgi:AcrR family transcriptional regulator
MAPSERLRGPRAEAGQAHEAILDAARRVFAENGWGGTTIRHIAREAGVDPALIHYYFVTKAELLNACTAPPPEWLDRVQASINAPIRRRGRVIVESALWAWTDPDVSVVLRAIVVISAQEPRTRDRLQFIVAKSLIAATAEHLDAADREFRASLIASQVIGLGFVRHLWNLEPLVSTPDSTIVDAVAPTIQRYLTQKLK